MKFNSETARAAGLKSSRAGTKNKVPKELQETLANILTANIDQLQDDLKELRPKERVDALLAIAAYVVPKMKAIEVNGTHELTNFEPPIIKFI